ncbi:hypothetical protein FRB99_007627 [Tulasnella sp. 403]|nr:hypothetical protein FRB99_007627 [Tulasnella sp. 403]
MLAFALTILAAISAFAAPSPRNGDLCGSNPSPEEIDQAEAEFAKLDNVTDSNPLATRDSSANSAPVEVFVYWHVIQANTTYAGGSLPSSQIEKQIDVLNGVYNTAGISFTLSETDYTTNAEWFDELGPSNSDVEREVKEQLRQGDKTTLNIYSAGFKNEGTLLGQSTFPRDYTSNPELDGIMLLYSCLPGGALSDFNLGHVGLYHTFQRGCKGHGDHISDTPAEARPTFDCPTEADDSCPGQPGLDPIHNFMDYTNDPCRTQLTDGQFKRARKQLKHYRGLPL